MTSIQLSIHSRAFGGTHLITLDHDRVTLGRASRCHVQLPLQIISGHHLTFARHGLDYTVQDMHSTNGTLRNGTKLPPGKPIIIRDQDVLEILDVSITIHIKNTPTTELEGFTLSDSMKLARNLVQEALQSHEETHEPTTPYLQYQKQTFPLPPPPQPLYVGANPSSHIHIPDAPQTWFLLHHHEELWHVEPIAELLLDGQPCTTRRQLHHMAELSCPDLTLTFFDPLEAFLLEMEEDPAFSNAPVSTPEPIPDPVVPKVTPERPLSRTDETPLEKRETDNNVLEEGSKGDVEQFEEPSNEKSNRPLPVFLLLLIFVAMSLAVGTILFIFGVIEL